MNRYDTPHSQRDLDALARETPRVRCANSPCAGRLCSEIDAAGCHCAARATGRSAEAVLADFTRNAAPGTERALNGPEIDPVSTIRATDDGSARLAGEDE
ncbi:hypothetical protein [Paenirhodobacter populi]|uniref:Uncharacterized protein n=1 Tax=Paenirhodobacter populi TaxID=2306993 RepID=A0A443IPM3_9RHOB|nr:hypothetical protein [Sinirhodobacter populi]RWR08471.1 hypothetical protein D2T33_15355 [Sinirhodobacter populi]